MLKVIPLGGLGEIGLNAMVFEVGDEKLLVDCGLMFPPADLPGVDIVVPDFRYLLEERQKVKGVVLTHAHEDHIGALPYLLRDLPVPVYGTRLTLAFLKHKLDEMGLQAELREIAPREPFAVGAHFQVEAIRVCHSIPDAVGLALKSPLGTVIHTGDFKLDGAPIDGRPTDLERLGELGDEGVVGLFSDSTNSELDEESGMEASVAQAFERIVQKTPGRVIFTMFASNLNRLQHLFGLAEQTGRKVVLHGRSMVRNVELARRLGYVKFPDGLLIAPEQASSFPKGRILIMATGAQGEPRSGLASLLAEDSGRPLRLEGGDTVVFSARTIPGNEKAVTALYDSILARGGFVLHPGNTPDVHVSGHGGRQEQRRMLDAVRPRHFVPIHGELHHLHHHLEVAESVQVPSRFLMRDGDVLGFDAHGAQSLGRVPVGRIFRERDSGAIIDPDALAEREEISHMGLVVALVAIDRSNNRLLWGPHLYGRGLLQHEMQLLPQMSLQVTQAFLEVSETLRQDEPLVKETLVRAVRKAFKAHGERRPSVMPIVMKF